MPGRSYVGSLAPADPQRAATSARLAHDVQVLAEEIGPRSVPFHAEGLERAADHVQQAFEAAGLAVRRQTYTVGRLPVHNLVATLEGSEHPERVVVVGAHYDAIEGLPGADDNASGVAVLLELARRLAGQSLPHTLQLVAFVNEEPPFFRTPAQGSAVYARSLAGSEVVAMLSIETVGYYRSEAGTQHYPAPFSWFYPNTGDFIGFVGNLRSRQLVRQVVGSFRQHATLPSQGVAAPGAIEGIGWSDHEPFWQQGWPALMVTDTALFRNPHYHEPSDLPPTVDSARMALLVEGLTPVIRELAGAEQE